MTTALKHLSFLLLFALSALLPNAAQAALPAADGDAFLCLRAKGGAGANTSYMVNIGPVTQFIGASGLVNVDLGAMAPGSPLTDIVNLYGEDWTTRADLVWSVHAVYFDGTGTIDPNTMFASRAEPSPGTKSTSWPSPSLFAAGSPAGKMLQLRNAYANGAIVDKQFVSTNSSKALTQTPNAESNYVSFMPGGTNTTQATAFSWFNAALGIENTFVNGTASSVVDFYQLTPGSAPTHLGGFRLNDSAQLVFSPDISFFVGPAQAKFTAATAMVSESDVSGKITLTISRVGNANTAFTLNLSTANGTATAGTDYVSHTNTAVSFASGETSKTVDVTVIERAGFQGDRAFTATLTVSSGVAELIVPSTIEVTIIESTPQPAILALSSATYSVAENAATGLVTVTVNRTGATGTAATVNLSTQDGTATTPTDYTGQTNTQVSFAAGELSKTVDIAIANRAGFQGDRAFSVSLSNPGVNAELGAQTSATVTIQENEPNPAGIVAFSASTFSFTANSVNLAISLARTAGTTGTVSVDVSVSGGTLTAGQDFTFSSPATVSFAEGQSAAVLNIPLLGGASPLPGTIQLQLSNATGGVTIGTLAGTTVTVTPATVVTPDRIPPKLKVISPKAGKSAAIFDVNGTVQDPDAVDRVEVRLNGAAVQFANLGTPSGGITPFNLDDLQAENGPNTLLVQAFDVKGTATKVTRVSFTYTNIRPQLAGTYMGLITPTAATPPADNLHNASGLLTLSVNATGAFTGKVLIGGATLPIGGVFANDQTARFKTAFGSTLPLLIKGKAPVALGDLSLSVAVGKVTGAIGTTATIDADRAAFDGKTPATTPDPAYLANKGKYRAVVPSKVQAALAIALYPQGDGVGGITVTKQGKLTFKGKLADGTPVSMSGLLSSGLKAALYVPLYAKKGSIGGVVTLDKTAPDSDVEGADFLWLRPAIAKAKHYPAGWADGVKVDLVGALYAVPSATSVLLGLGAEDPAAGNATFVAQDGKLTANVTKNVSVSPKNKVTNAPATDKTFKVTIAAPTGAISGFFPHTDGTKTKFSGVILQKGVNQAGFGYFLSNAPSTGPSGESGGISLTAK